MKTENLNIFLEFLNEYFTKYEILEWDWDTNINTTIWGFIQMINKFTADELEDAIAYMQGHMISIDKKWITIWAEPFCLLGLLFEKTNDKARAYFAYQESINSLWVDNEMYRTFYVSMLNLWENYFVQEYFLNKWIKKYPKNVRPYINAFSLYYERNKDLCLEMINKIKEIDEWIYEIYCEDIEKEILELRKTN
jgi:hypothetical protein